MEFIQELEFVSIKRIHHTCGIWWCPLNILHVQNHINATHFIIFIILLLTVFFIELFIFLYCTLTYTIFQWNCVYFASYIIILSFVQCSSHHNNKNKPSSEICSIQCIYNRHHIFRMKSKSNVCQFIIIKTVFLIYNTPSPLSFHAVHTHGMWM